MIEPSINDMLVIADDCGLTTIEEAYNNYMNHYDCFFDIANYKVQYEKFKSDLIDYGLLVPATSEPRTLYFNKVLSVKDAIHWLNH